jgi:hypothetical protein
MTDAEREALARSRAREPSLPALACVILLPLGLIGLCIADLVYATTRMDAALLSPLALLALLVGGSFWLSVALPTARSSLAARWHGGFEERLAAAREDIAREEAFMRAVGLVPSRERFGVTPPPEEPAGA